MTTRKEAENAVHTLLNYLETDSQREGLMRTPERVIDSWDEIFSGYKTNPEEILEATFNAEGYDGIVYSVILSSTLHVNIIFNRFLEKHM